MKLTRGAAPMSKKLVHLAIALLMALPAAVTVLPAASAQDTVPVAPTVAWVNQVNHLQSLYLTFENLREPTTQAEIDQPDCAQQTRPAYLSTTKNVNDLDEQDPRTPCFFTASLPSNPLPAQSSVAVFTMKEGLLKSFNVSGNNSLVYVHQGNIPSGVTLHVQVKSGGTTIATVSIPGRGSGPYVKEIPLGATSRFEFKRADRISVSLNGVIESSAASTSWSVEDWGSRLEIRGVDALRASTWVTDETATVRTLFRPLARDVTTSSRLIGFFAVQSAFALADAKGAANPQFSMERGGVPVPLGTSGSSTLVGTYNTTASQDTDGRAVWNFPGGGLDYRGLTAGEYNITVSMPYHQGGAITQGTRTKIFVTTQSVSLTPYDDKDPTTSPSPLETNAHDVAAGQSTTYIFLLNNTGSVNDTFRIDATFVSGAPAGWSAIVGGPGVTDRQVALKPLESKIVTITVNAPAGASTGSSSIFQVQATSSVDPTARSQSTTVVSTVSNAVTRELRIISDSRDVPVVPGEDTIVPVYVWNRGTRLANVGLEVQGNILQDWSIQFREGDLSARRIVVPSVPAGGIAIAELVVRAPARQSDGSQDIVLNATQTDVGGIATEQPLHFVIKPIAGVRVDILQRVLEIDHIIELTGNFTPGVGEQQGTVTRDPRCDQTATAGTATASGAQGCFDDGVDGAWFRTWVTNTGKQTEAFDVTVDTIQKGSCSGAFAAQPAFFVRAANGAASPQGGVATYTTPSLKPGETAEIYLWRPSDRTANEACTDHSFSFVVNAKGKLSGAIGRAAGKAIAQDNAGSQYTSLVYLEHVARTNAFNANLPLVDVTNASKRTLTTGVEVNTTKSQFVRLTHAAGWATFTDTRTGIPFDATARVRVDGVDKDGGWNVSIRKANGNTNTVTNPWVDSLEFTNTENPNNRREAWSDFEVEVRIEAPRGQNGTGLAGEQDHFTITASIRGSDKTSTLEYKAVITELVNLTLESDARTILAHPGQAGAGLVYVNNTGSTDAIVSLKAQMDATTTPNAGAWSVEPSSQPLTLPAFKNQTVALLVTPPSGAVAGEMLVTAEYAPNPLEPLVTTNKTLRLPVQVVPRGTLTLGGTTNEVSIEPGGVANYTLAIVNTGTQPVDFRISGSAIPNWTADLSPRTGTLSGGETRRVDYVLTAPRDVVNGTRFSSVVVVQEATNSQNFDVRPVTVSILGGRAIPSLSIPKIEKTVDRNGVQYFEVAVKNVGSAAGRIDLTPLSDDAAWQVGVQNARGDPITSVTLGPNALEVVNVTVRAPLVVSPNWRVPVKLLAEAGGQTTRATLQALVHDYGVSVTLKPSQVDAIAGLPSEFTLTLRNTGNDNDTLNVSANLVDIPEWRVEMSLERVRLEPGQSTDVRATVRPPTDPLPTPRAYSLKFFAGTVGGQAVNIPINDSVVAVVNILNYRPMDVDRDDQLEVAVDFDRNAANGFEKFYEVFPDGVQSREVAIGRINGKATFFLDVPRDRPADGVADVWFDPETVYAYEIRHAPDLNFDNAPDYLLDSNRDGKIDQAFDSVAQRFFVVTEIKAFGDERVQYVADTNQDGKVDRFYDPEARIVTRATPVNGDANVIGLDTDNDGKVDKHYDVKANSVSDARLSSAGNFFTKYWYVFVIFAILVLLTIFLIVRRRRA